jgi:hypothetical protein
MEGWALCSAAQRRGTLSFPHELSALALYALNVRTYVNSQVEPDARGQRSGVNKAGHDVSLLSFGKESRATSNRGGSGRWSLSRRVANKGSFL